MSGYTKLFARILDSTVWRESDPTRLLWITMLALADKEGNVYCTIPGLADRARITLIECEKGLEKFQSPDKYSWSQEDEGRRIRPITGGWFLINHEKFRNMMSREQKREKTRIRVSNWREKKKSEASVTVTKSNASNDKHLQKQLQEHNTYTEREIPYSSEKISPLPKYTQNDHNEKHLRLIAAAEKKISQSLQASIGRDTAITDQQFIVMVCQEVGITVERYFELKEKQKKWPYQITPVL